MKSIDIRARFFNFFSRQGHMVVPSSPVIPAEDPTLLFTNAGMNQFKDLFLGREKRAYTRAVSIQKCIRAGGKHNDLENVGFTSRHLTFFEMMGNFSFGDYFKKEAIRFAWDFLTSELAINKEILWASVYEADSDAYALWKDEIGLPTERIVRLGAADNFWQMGDTGPCGPCSEIYVDRGASIGCGEKNCAPGCSCDRFLEIWNLVFMQFDRQKDGTDKPLKNTGVDTGMGLERLCTLLQNKSSVFETDLFGPIIQKTEALTGVSYEKATPALKAAFHVVADHIRSVAFAIADGGTPSADGRGYVIRKIIRRAALFANKLSNTIFFPQLIDGLIEALGEQYPELVNQRKTITTIITQEVEQFSKNLLRGQQMLSAYFAENNDVRELSGSFAFTLYDTYGFPLELTKVLASEHGITVDLQGFTAEMERQRTLSLQKETVDALPIPAELHTTFTGYSELSTTTKILAIIVNNQLSDTAPAGALCWIIPESSPLYAASGGQISDQGTALIAGISVPIQAVHKQGNVIACSFIAPQQITRDETITLQVDAEKRHNAMRNHSATHLLQAALMKTLGTSVKQSGSLVTPDYLRFDFTYHEQPSAEQMRTVENIVNHNVQNNLPVVTTISTLQQAQQKGVIAFFGEKYNPEKVRVVSMGEASAELCGGTHVKATGEIGLFKIIEITSPSAGNRRIVALTGPSAVAYVQDATNTLKSISLFLKVAEGAILENLEKQRAQQKEVLQELRKAKRLTWKLQIPDWIKKTEIVNGLNVGIILEEQLSGDDLRELAQKLTTAQPGLWFVISTEPEHERINFIASINTELSHRYNLKHLLEELKKVGMRGGGSAASIQGGAQELPQQLLAVVKQWIESH